MCMYMGVWVCACAHIADVHIHIKAVYCMCGYLWVCLCLTSADAWHAGTLTAPPWWAEWQQWGWRRLRRWWTGQRSCPHSGRTDPGALSWTRAPLKALQTQWQQQGSHQNISNILPNWFTYYRNSIQGRERSLCTAFFNDFQNMYHNTAHAFVCVCVCML